jgi:diketogulonate reductase-like aldo/keto reductase
VGEAVRESGIPREEIFVVTKLSVKTSPFSPWQSIGLIRQNMKRKRVPLTGRRGGQFGHQLEEPWV